MKKILLSLFVFLGLSISFSIASGSPTYYELEYNLCNYSYNTTLNQIINQDYYTILGYAGNNPTCYHIKYYDPANLYGFRSYGNSMLEYRSNNSIYDFGNCAGSFNDLMNRYDLSLSNGDSNMCNQIYGGSLPMYVSFYFPYNSEDCSSIQSDYDSCKSSLNTLSGNLATCQSDLLTCQNNSSSCDYSGYILESEINQEYCVSNLLCPENSGGMSSFFINNIPMLSSYNYFVNIPEEIHFDYATGENNFILDIEGYNVDTEYIDSIISVQNYKPTSEDFTNLVGMLAPYSKYLIFLVFIFIIWAWIKKPFKSKKF